MLQTLCQGAGKARRRHARTHARGHHGVLRRCGRRRARGARRRRRRWRRWRASTPSRPPAGSTRCAGPVRTLSLSLERGRGRKGEAEGEGDFIVVRRPALRGGRAGAGALAASWRRAGGRPCHVLSRGTRKKTRMRGDAARGRRLLAHSRGGVGDGCRRLCMRLCTPRPCIYAALHASPLYICGSARLALVKPSGSRNFHTLFRV